MDRPSGPRPSDRRGWVGGGSMDASPKRMMGGNMSPQGGMSHSLLNCCNRPATQWKIM